MYICVIATEWSIIIDGDNDVVSDINYLKAFDESDYFKEESVSISVYKGGIHSSNINI